MYINEFHTEFNEVSLIHKLKICISFRFISLQFIDVHVLVSHTFYQFFYAQTLSKLYHLLSK